MWTTTHLGHWMPLSWMSYGLDFLVWEMEPMGYHLTNLLLHAGSAALLVALTARLLRIASGDTGSQRGADIAIASGVAALTFAVHPLRVESVAWVTERRDVLSGLLALTSAWFYLRYASEPSANRRNHLIAIAFFAAGLLAKATVLTLPALLFLLECHPLRRIGGSRGWRGPEARAVYLGLLPFALLSVASALVSVRALGTMPQLPALGKLAVSAYSLVFYTVKSVVPTGLAPLYMMPDVVDPLAPRFAFSLLTALALTAGAVAAWRRWPAITIGWLAFGAALLPMLGLRQNGFQIAADRYTYHAAPALAVLVGAAVLILLRWRRSAVLLASSALMIVLGAATWRQTGYWQDSETLWRRAIETGNGGAIAHNNYGNALLGRGLVREAETAYRRALELDPRYAEAHMDLGVLLSQEGRDAEAEGSLRRALELRADYDDAMVNLGLVRSRLGAHDEAIALYESALRLDPRDVAAEVNWGNALVRLGRPEEAIRRYERALALDPGQAQARANLEVARRMLAATVGSTPP